MNELAQLKATFDYRSILKGDTKIVKPLLNKGSDGTSRFIDTPVTKSLSSWTGKAKRLNAVAGFASKVDFKLSFGKSFNTLDSSE